MKIVHMSVETSFVHRDRLEAVIKNIWGRDWSFSSPDIPPGGSLVFYADGDEISDLDWKELHEFVGSGAGCDTAIIFNVLALSGTDPAKLRNHRQCNRPGANDGYS